jgi:hypothetical protein
VSNSVTNPAPSWGDPSLSDAEKANLAAMSARMIPASAEFKVPGADDPLIQADFAKSIGRDATAVHNTLALIEKLAGGNLAALPEAQQDEICAKLREQGGIDLTLTTRIVLQCYYRDDRVMISLGMEPRPPFPKGHTLPQGDWSLLDPVRARGKIWRDA